MYACFSGIGSGRIAYNKNRMKWRIPLVLAALCAMQGRAQSVRVYSEFAQIDAAGNVVAPESPREILSPAVPRNGFTSFQVVIQVPDRTRFLMYVGQNPENAVRVTLYRRRGEELELVSLPYESDGTQVLWMDVWVQKDVPAARIKLEPQVNPGDEGWVIYPMEVRIREPQIPDVLPSGGLRTLLCGGPESGPPTQVTITAGQLHLRNERQDAALAAQATAADRDELRKRLGGCNPPRRSDPEAYLRVRDFFFTPLWMRIQKNP